PAPSTRSTTLPRTGFVWYARIASASGNSAPTTGRTWPASISRAISSNSARRGWTMKNASRVRSSCASSSDAATVTSRPPGCSTPHDRRRRSPPTVSNTASTAWTGVCLCWRQHCLEDDFDELLREGQPRYADQIAGALRPRRGVGFFAHLAGGHKRRIDVENIERLFHHVVEGRPETRQEFCSVGIGHPHLLFHRREVGRFPGFIKRRGRDHGPLVVVAELAGDIDSVTDLDRLCVSVSIFPRHTEIGGLFAIRCGRVRHILISCCIPGSDIRAICPSQGSAEPMSPGRRVFCCCRLASRRRRRCDR